MESYEDEASDFEPVVDAFSLDCADVFATMLTRRFPRVTLARGFANPWRPLWQITLPEDEYGVKDVDEYAYKVMMDLFWKQSTLISYIITRHEAGAEEGTADEPAG